MRANDHLLGDDAMTDMIPLPYKIGLFLCMAAVIAFGSYFKGYNNANSKYIEFKAEVLAAQAQAENDMQRRLRDSDSVTANLKSDLAVALDSLRKHPVVRVLPAARCDSGSGLTVAPSATGINAATVTPATDTAKLITADECQAFLNDGVEDSTRLAWWQYWYEQQRKVSQ